MNKPIEPLVAVLTPVYNGERYLAECIESVLAQTYQNWEYVILNNCSQDSTLQIAKLYEAKDRRIRVLSNDATLDIISNHNRAFGLVPPDSKYCKIVSADDWLLPQCLEQMVSVAEENPSVGIVGTYQLSGGGADWADWCIKWDQIPYPSVVVPGREVGRRYMLGGPDVFGSPTSLLYRSDLVRSQDRFYPNSSAEADTSACCQCLSHTDYGFVHQVLSYERVHIEQITTTSRSLNAYISSRIRDLLTYGSCFLSPEERSRRIAKLFNEYYDFLASSALRRREREFWRVHQRLLTELGYPLSQAKLARHVLKAVVRLVLSPQDAVGKVARVLSDHSRGAPDGVRGVKYAAVAVAPSLLTARNPK
jgi:glycosyltransferase involved in cell wall biosynthesis